MSAYGDEVGRDVACCFDYDGGRTLIVQEAELIPMSPAVAYYRPSPSLQERYDEIDSDVQNAAGAVPQDTRDKILNFFLVSHAIIEEHSAKLIWSEVFDTEAQTQESLDYVMEDMSQSHREDLLFKSDVINGSLYSKLQKTRGARNDLAHTYGQPLAWVGDLKQKAEKAIEGFDDLHEHCVS